VQIIFFISISAFAFAGATMGTDELVYHGHLTVDGRPYTGEAELKFAIFNPDGRVLWRNDQADNDGIPRQAVSATIEKGAYIIILGRPDGNMAPLPSSVADAFPDVRLRVWAATGDLPFQTMPDENITGLAKIETPVSPPPAGPPVNPLPPPPKAAPADPPPTPAALPPSSSEIPPGMTLFVLEDRVRYRRGSQEAAFILLEYSDYRCSHCRLFHEITYPKILSEYVDSGKMLYVPANFPLQSNNISEKAAEAAYCAGDQGQYWAMRDRLFESPLRKEDEFVELATDLGLDVPQFFSCLDRGFYKDLVDSDKREGVQFGVKRTPTFVLGRRLANGDVAGELIAGSRMWTEFKTIINRILQGP